MKKATLTATVIVAIAWVLPAAYGQSAATQPALPTGFMSLPGGGWGSYEDFFKVCELDKDQLKKASDIAARRNRDVQNATKAFQKAKEAYDKAAANKDAALMEAAQAQITQASLGINEGFRKAETDTLAVLTPEQKARWRQYVALKEIKARYAAIKLTDEQWDNVVDAAQKLSKDSTLRIGDLYEKVNALLAPDQKAKWIFAAARYAEMDKVCHFTPEQIDKLAAIEGKRCKTTAELRAQQELLFKAEREAMAAGDRNIVSVQPMWQEWHKRDSEADEKMDQKIRGLLTDKQKTAWKDAGGDKGAGKPASN